MCCFQFLFKLFLRLCLPLIAAVLWCVDSLYQKVVGPVLDRIVESLSRRWRNGDRRKQERQERDLANSTDEVAKQFVDTSGGRFSQFQELADMGSRMQKMWYLVTMAGETERKIMTLAPVSSNCPIILEKSTVKRLNKFLSMVKHHPLLHAVEEVDFLPESGRLVMIQPLMKEGSLKDLIYNSSPTADWSCKYGSYSKDFLDLELVASYGRQVLEAVLYLYELGLMPLGHIHTGNIFVEGEMCLLGGYENRLLGYRTRLYNLCRAFNCSEDIDTVMFGYVIFEMCCGYELTRLVPSERDYKAVREREVREVLQFIFARNTEGQFLHNIKEILALKYFQEAHVPYLEGEWTSRSQLGRDVQGLIAKVMKGKPRRQPGSVSAKKNEANWRNKIKETVLSFFDK